MPSGHASTVKLSRLPAVHMLVSQAASACAGSRLIQRQQWADHELLASSQELGRAVQGRHWMGGGHVVLAA